MLDLGLSRVRYTLLFSGVYLAMFLIRVAFGVVTITFSRYMEDVDPFVFSLVVAAVPLMELVTVPWVGILADRYGRKGVLLAGLSLGAFSLYGIALTQNVWLLGVVNGIHGIAAAFILVTTLAIIASYAAPDKRGREMGIFNFVNMFGWFFGFALGSFLLDPFANDLRYTFVVAGALATGGLVYSNYTVREPERAVEIEEKADIRQLFSIIDNRGILLLSAAWFLVYVFLGGAITFLGKDATADQGLGIGGTKLGFSLLIIGVVIMFSQLLFGWLSDRYGREPFMILGALGFLGFMLTIVLGIVGAPAEAEMKEIFQFMMSEHGLLFAIFAFCTLAFAPAALAAFADEAKESAEGTTMSVYSLVLNLGMIAGPTLVGAFRTLTGGQGVLMLYLTISVLLLASVVARTWHVRKEQEKAVQAIAAARPPQ